MVNMTIQRKERTQTERKSPKLISSHKRRVIWRWLIQTLSMLSRGKSSWTFSGPMRYCGVTCQCVRVIWYLISSTRAAVEAMRTLPGWWKPTACSERRYRIRDVSATFQNMERLQRRRGASPVPFPPPGSRRVWCCQSGLSSGWCLDGNKSSDLPEMQTQRLILPIRFKLGISHTSEVNCTNAKATKHAFIRKNLH